MLEIIKTARELVAVLERIADEWERSNELLDELAEIASASNDDAQDS